MYVRNKSLRPVDICLFSEVKKQGRILKPSSLTPNNGLHLTVVGRFIAFLAMFLEEMRLM